MERCNDFCDQLGIVVRDIDHAALQWSRLGFGPFFIIRNIRFDSFLYEGSVADSPLVSIALGVFGGIQLEIIQQHDDTPSAYRDFLGSGREGLQHVCSFFSSPKRYDQRYRELVKSGHPPTHEGTSMGGAVRFAYFRTDIPGAMNFEISEAGLPVLRDLFDTIRAAAHDWDGTNPIREFVA